MKRYRVIVRSFEGTERSPTVTHIFHGRSQKEACDWFERHLEQDPYLQANLRNSKVFLEDVVTSETWEYEG